MSLRVDRLTCVYGDLVALTDVSVEAVPGRITVIAGPNAAGKSTLLAAIIGAQRPSRGAVLLDDRPVHRWRPRELARRIAYVPQRSVVAASFVVEDVVRLGRFALPPEPRRVAEALDRLQLTDIAHRPYPRLSVGQQQRVTLARAVAQLEPAGCLVLDEPMSAMDLAHVRDAVELLRELADSGVTVLVAMHDLPLASAVADEAWLLRDGRLLDHGPADRVLCADRLEQVFDVPFDRLGTGGGRVVLMPGWMGEGRDSGEESH